jgi:O-antigen/teichoic acid export membrane protein
MKAEALTEDTLSTPALTQEINRSLVRGSSWMVGMRLGIRGIGLVSTMILARLLTPADFGIIAMAMLVIGFVEVFSETGQQAAIIRLACPERAHYDSAFTMAVMINGTLTLIIFAIAPFSAQYFHDPRIVPVIRILSLRVLLGGLLNIGTVDFRRSLDFAREFRFGLARKLASFVVTISFALIWRNYWALVVGTVAGHCMEVAVSYVMHPFRPRPCLTKVGEIWSYSIWMLVQSLGRFFDVKIDDVVVAGVASPLAMGQYTVSCELGALPLTELMDPISRALFPNYARIAANPVLLRDTYLNVLSITATICIAFGTGLALVARDVVMVVLGPQWTAVAPLFVIFAIGGAVNGINNTVFAVFNASGDSKAAAVQGWMRVIACLPAMLWAASTGVLVNFALARLAMSLLLSPTYFARLGRVIPVRFSHLVGVIWRPLTAALVMTLALTVAALREHVASLALRLPLESAFGAAIFIATQLSLWWLAGRPPGLEDWLVTTARDKLWRSKKPGAMAPGFSPAKSALD